MEEAPDDQYVESEKEEAPVEHAEAPEAPAEPEAPVCKPVKKNLKEKVQCACGRWMSEHTYRYQHKCKAQSVAEASAPAPPPPKLVRARAAKETVVQEKLPPPEKPVKKRAAIKKAQVAEDADHPLDVQAPKEYQPVQPQMDIYQAMLFNRQEQARMYHERMLAPYQQMFSLRR